MLTHILLPNGKYYTTSVDGRTNEFMFEFTTTRGTRYAVPVKRGGKNDKNIAKPTGKIKRVSTPRVRIHTDVLSADNPVSNISTGITSGITLGNTEGSIKALPVDTHVFIGASDNNDHSVSDLQKDLDNLAASKKAIIPDSMEGV